ncbi:hypothetical protein VTI74DRAFT_5628 [Chaetomium olivicolor]
MKNETKKKKKKRKLKQGGPNRSTSWAALPRSAPQIGVFPGPLNAQSRLCHQGRSGFAMITDQRLLISRSSFRGHGRVSLSLPWKVERLSCPTERALMGGHC